MRRISVCIAVALIMVFAFTSVAWAGAAINRDLQAQNPAFDNSTPLAQKDEHKGGHGGGSKHHGGGHSGIKHGGGDKHGGGGHGGIKHGGGSKHKGGHDGIKHGGGSKHKGGHDGIKHGGGSKHKGGHDGIRHKGGHDGIRHHDGGKHHNVIRHHGGRHFDKHRHHHWGRDWPHHHWGHHFHDWDWFVGFGILTLGAYYLADNAQEAIYIHFETEDRTYFQQLSLRYGDYIFRERVAGFSGLGWRYYWIDDTNVVCVFVRDDGYAHTFIWNRADAGGQAVALGLLTAGQLAVYDGYSANMPAAMAEEYVRVVMWSQTEWQ